MYLYVKPDNKYRYFSFTDISCNNFVNDTEIREDDEGTYEVILYCGSGNDYIIPNISTRSKAEDIVQEMIRSDKEYETAIVTLYNDEGMEEILNVYVLGRT